MKSAVLCFSGGLDSTVLLWELKNKPDMKVRCLSVNYGQRHSKELIAATEIAKLADVEHKIIDLQSVRELMLGSSQTDSSVDVPEGHYAQENMKLTVVPNRNMLLLALAGAWATATGSDYIAYAAHAGDHTVYWDCRPNFMDAIAQVMVLAEPKPIFLLSPFAKFNKTWIAMRGFDLKAPMHLTWTCYAGREKHCGRCGSCCERAISFYDAKVEDPTEYEDSSYFKRFMGE